MKLLITGGGGLIGQAIAKKHLEKGDEVYIYDTRVNRYNDYNNMVGKDVSSLFSHSIEDMLRYIKPDIISNQAALVGVGQGQYDILNYTINNIGSTAQLLQAMLNTNILPRKIIHAGSMGPYGDYPQAVKIKESAKPLPESIYAVTKLAQEELIKVFSKTYKVPAISLRYFSVYSTSQNPLNPYTGVLSVIANQILNNSKIEIYDDGSQSRDLINVDDIADAHLLSCDKIIFNQEFIAINIGTGEQTTLSYVAEMMKSLLKSDKEIVYNGLHRRGDVMHSLADNNLAYDLLGWYPKHNIEEDIVKYCEYIDNNRKKFSLDNTIDVEQKNIKERGLIDGS